MHDFEFIIGPSPDNAGSELIEAMDRLHRDNPEVFDNYRVSLDPYTSALQKINDMSDAELIGYQWSEYTDHIEG